LTTTRQELASLERKAHSVDIEKASQSNMRRGMLNFAVLQIAAFATGYGRGRVGDGDSFSFASVPVPIDIVAAAVGVTVGLANRKKPKTAGPAMAVGGGALASFLSHHGNKLGQKGKAAGNLFGAAPMNRAQVLFGQQYDIVGAANAGMGNGGAEQFARNAW
jgi:hypothetical protein